MIGKTIYGLLSNDGTLTALVGTKIQPYVVPEKTAYPFVTYVIDSITPEYNKGGWANDTVVFSVRSFSQTYTELQNIVSAVRNALECKTDTGIGRIQLKGFKEGYSDDQGAAFINILTFETIVKTY